MPPGSVEAELAPSFSPLYQQIKSLLLNGLRLGEWKPGELIPSEIELATRFRVSQGTVRKAIDELAADNLLIRRQGRALRQIVDCKRLRAPADVARHLAVRNGESVLRIQRVLHFAGKPTILEVIWLPGAPFKGLTTERLRQDQGPMYAMFEAEFGIRMVRADEKIRAVLASAADSFLLDVAMATPLLSVERTAFTYNDTPMELRRGLYVTNTHYYRNALN